MLKSAMALVLRDDEPFSGDQVERISYVRFMFEYPLHSELEDGAWIDPANIAEFARVAEASGIDGIALTDHPAPSKKWPRRAPSGPPADTAWVTRPPMAALILV